MAVYLPGCYGQPRTAIPMPYELTAVGDQQLGLEGLLTIFANMEWAIHSGPGNAAFQAWLSRLDFSAVNVVKINTGYKAVTGLVSPYFPLFPFYSLPTIAPNHDIELIGKCTNLRFFRLHWQSHGDCSKDTIEGLRANYRLDTMVANVKKLEFLRFCVDGMTQLTKEYLTRLPNWFKGKFETRGQRVTIFVNGTDLSLMDEESDVEDGSNDDSQDD